MSTVISVENVSKAYRLGAIGGRTLRDDLARWWARARKKPDPLLRIGQKEQIGRDGETVWALRDVSLRVEEGTVLGIVGRNGAGKSTLLKILSQVTAPTKGEVKVKGRIASLLEVGTGFHPELTGRENIYLNGAILGMTRAEVSRKLDEIIAFSEVVKYIDTPVKRYSSGMYVRLAFAVAAHLEPEILIVDEVLAVGDGEFQRKCVGKMGDVARGGRTVLFVSHNMDAVLRLCRQAILLQDGTIGEAGGAQSVVAAYRGDRRSRVGIRSLAQVERAVPGLVLSNASVGTPECPQSGLIRQHGPMSLTCRLEFQREVSTLRVSFPVRDAGNRRVTTLSPLFSAPDLLRAVDGRRLDLRCDIDACSLVPGGYELDVWASLGDVSGLVEGVLSFQVVQANGFVPQDGSKHGAFLDVQHWSASPQPPVCAPAGTAGRV